MILEKEECVFIITRIFYIHISFITRHDICILENCLVTEISLQNEECFSSQRQDKLENFCTSFYIVLNQINDELPICSIVSSNFNARCSSWWRNDIRNSTVVMLHFLINAITLSFMAR